MFSNFFPEISPLWNNVEKYGTARETTHDNTMPRRKYAIFMPDNQGKNTDTHTLRSIHIAFLGVRWLHELFSAFRTCRVWFCLVVTWLTDLILRLHLRRTKILGVTVRNTALRSSSIKHYLLLFLSSRARDEVVSLWTVNRFDLTTACMGIMVNKVTFRQVRLRVF